MTEQRRENASVRIQLRTQSGNGKQVEVAVKKSCCFYSSKSAGKLRTMHLHNTATTPVPIHPSELLRVHGACWSILRQAHCKRYEPLHYHIRHYNKGRKKGGKDTHKQLLTRHTCAKQFQGFPLLAGNAPAHSALQ